MPGGRSSACAGQPTSVAAGDGQRLTGARMVAAVHCAPPENKPTPGERDTCAPWLAAEFRMIAVDAVEPAGRRQGTRGHERRVQRRLEQRPPGDQLLQPTALHRRSVIQRRRGRRERHQFVLGTLCVLCGSDVFVFVRSAT